MASYMSDTRSTAPDVCIHEKMHGAGTSEDNLVIRGSMKHTW